LDGQIFIGDEKMKLTKEDVKKYATEDEFDFLIEAYIGQEEKKKIAENVKKICNKYGVKGTLRIRHHFTLVLTVREGKIDFMSNYSPSTWNTRYQDIEKNAIENDKKRGYIQVNVYHFKDHFTDEAKDFLTEVIPAMNMGNHDNSDIQTDYFDVGWYVDVNIGEWDKPYKYTGE
jgi:hypothetical protein